MRAMAIRRSLIVAEERNIQRDLSVIRRSACGFLHRMIGVIEIGAFPIDSSIAHSNEHILTIQIVTFVDL